MKYILDSLRAEYTKYFDAMFNEFNFGSVFAEGYEPEDCYCDWEESGDMSDKYDVWFATGATRFVMGTDDCGYVVKFQLPWDKTDYGAIEVAVYNDAVVSGLKEQFTWCAKLMDYAYADFTFPVYVYERAECNHFEVSDGSYEFHYKSYCKKKGLNPEDKESRKSWSNCCCYGNDCHYASSQGLIYYAFSLWGMDEDMRNEFVALLYRHKVNDLHSGNWGYIDNKLVLTDFAGYDDPNSRDYVCFKAE